ncbi:MAG: DUF58 domain-containing protein [Alcaligenaceae bacterium]
MFAFLKRFKRRPADTQGAVPARGLFAGVSLGVPLGTSGGTPLGVSIDAAHAPEHSAIVPTSEALLRQLEWTVIRRLDGQLQGDYRTLFRGAGLMLADLREYQAHDDVRHIDWNVTARMQTPYVREHQEDREITAWFVVDLSGSVDFGSGAISKRTLAIECVAVLSRLLTQHGNRIGALLYTGAGGHANVFVPARSGRRQVLHVIESMARAESVKQTQETDLGKLLIDVQSVLKRRSTVFVLSDFLSQPGWDRALSQLARRHEVVAIRLFDPIEVVLPNSGLLVMQDAETGEQIFVDSYDKAFRQRFADQALLREQQLSEHFANAGVDCLELQTDEPIDQALVRFTRLRKRRSQLAAGATANTSASVQTSSAAGTAAGTTAATAAPTTAATRAGATANTLVGH